MQPPQQQYQFANPNAPTPAINNGTSPKYCYKAPIGQNRYYWPICQCSARCTYYVTRDRNSKGYKAYFWKCGRATGGARSAVCKFFDWVLPLDEADSVFPPDEVQQSTGNAPLYSADKIDPYLHGSSNFAPNSPMRDTEGTNAPNGQTAPITSYFKPQDYKQFQPPRQTDTALILASLKRIEDKYDSLADEVTRIYKDLGELSQFTYPRLQFVLTQVQEVHIVAKTISEHINQGFGDIAVRIENNKRPLEDEQPPTLVRVAGKGRLQQRKSAKQQKVAEARAAFSQQKEDEEVEATLSVDSEEELQDAQQQTF